MFYLGDVLFAKACDKDFWQSFANNPWPFAVFGK